MTHCDLSTLQKYLAKYGWQWEEQQQQLVSRWESSLRDYQLQVRCTDTFIFFEVELFDLSTQLAPALATAMHNHVYLFNKRLSHAKLLISDNNIITLYCDALCLDFSYNQFERLLGIIGYYADLIYEEVAQTFHAENAYASRLT